jgi:hypothetical protein|tara:strand:+ start:44 stop:634 length:591 start_codon:yes stop_codon:yes gene_type:complete
MTPKTTAKTRKPRTVKVTAIPELPKNPFVFEILDLASKQRTKAKKVAVLQRYGDLALKQVMKWNYDTSIVSALPEGEVPYGNFEDDAMTSGNLTTKITLEVRRMHEQGNFSLGASDSQGRTTIRREARNFYRFVRGGQDSLSNLRRETLFINILQGLHPLEAEILVLVKDKRLEEQYNISKDVVSEAFPDIIWGDA